MIKQAALSRELFAAAGRSLARPNSWKAIPYALDQGALDYGQPPVGVGICAIRRGLV